MIQDLIESKHIRFLDKNETMRDDKNLFPLINTLSINMMTIANSDGIIFFLRKLPSQPSQPMIYLIP